MSALKSNRWAIALIASLAVNIFLIAALATNAFRHPPGRGFAGAPFSMPWAIRVLGGDMRPLAFEIFESNFDEFRARRRALAEDRGRLGGLLAEHPFDRARFAATLAKLRGDSEAAQLIAHEAMTELAVKLTPAQRKELSAGIEMGEARRQKRIAERRERRAERLRRTEK